jgi:hypothetical protein
MPEDRAELLTHYNDMHAAMRAAIDGLSDELMSEPSLDGWSIKDHLLHLSLWDDVRADEVERISAGQETVWRMNGEQDAAYSALGHDLRLETSAAQARWEWEHARRRLIDAISSATERGLDRSLYGEAGLRSTHEAQHTEWILRWRGEKGV